MIKTHAIICVISMFVFAI